MIARREWHQPKLRMMEAGSTAQTDLDALHQDPNDDGDVQSWEDNGIGGETTTGLGRTHIQFDAHS